MLAEKSNEIGKNDGNVKMVEVILCKILAFGHICLDNRMKITSMTCL